jgi:hypothetical protein
MLPPHQVLPWRGWKLERSRSQAASPTIEDEQMTLENGHLRDQRSMRAIPNTIGARSSQALIYDGEQSPMVVRRKCTASPNDDHQPDGIIECAISKREYFLHVLGSPGLTTVGLHRCRLLARLRYSAPVAQN